MLPILKPVEIASLHNTVEEEFVSKDSVSGQEAHTAITSYADDVCQKHVVQDSTDVSFRAAFHPRTNLCTIEF